MKKSALLTIGLVGFVLQAHAQTSAQLQSCDQLYAHRGSALFDSVKCYQALAASQSGATAVASYERSLIALSAVVNANPKTPDERKAIDIGLTLVDELKTKFSSTADYHYWNAVWVSFDAIERDRGAVLPRHMFKSIKTIQSELRKAIDLDPSVHLYGPHRVLGLMHTQMPGVVGGDKKLAEKLLREAYEHVPSMSTNQYAYANILSINGKYDEAKMVLSKLLAMSSNELDPYPAEPLRSMAPETKLDLAKAKSLLDDLNSQGRK